MLKRLFILFIIVAAMMVSSLKEARAEQASVYPVRLYIFHSEKCPHCQEELKWIPELIKRYPNLTVKEFEVSNNIKNQSLFNNVSEHYKLKGYVPVNVIGDEPPIVGYDSEKGIGKEIEIRIQKCSAQGCPSWLDDIVGDGPLGDKQTYDIEPSVLKSIDAFSNNEQISSGLKDSLDVKVLGRSWQFNNKNSIFIIGLVLGLADGINPCMFSVIIFLLTYLLAIGSKKRALRAGIAFTLTTFIVYFLFMYGIIKAVDVLKLNDLMRKIVTIFALVAGAIMVKDFFFYGKGVSLEIPARFKPTMENLVKRGTLLSAILLAVLSSIVELPCTSGLPLAYATIITNNNLQPFWYLVWYNIFFVLPLVAIISIVLFAYAKVEHIEQWREKFKRYMRLVAGVLLLLLALALWKNFI